MTSESKPDRFQAFVSVSIAVISILGAIMGAVASWSYSQASDALREGTVASINREKITIQAYSDMFFELRSLAEYKIQITLALETAREAEIAWENGDYARAVTLMDRAKGYYSASEASQIITPDSDKYQARDGIFDEELYIADSMYESSNISELDTKDEDDLEIAENYFALTQTLIGSIIALSITLIFFTLAEIFESKIRYIWFILGIFALGSSLCYLIAIGIFPFL